MTPERAASTISERIERVQQRLAAALDHMNRIPNEAYADGVFQSIERELVTASALCMAGAQLACVVQVEEIDRRISHPAAPRAEVA